MKYTKEQIKEVLLYIRDQLIKKDAIISGEAQMSLNGVNFMDIVKQNEEDDYLYDIIVAYDIYLSMQTYDEDERFIIVNNIDSYIKDNLKI